MADSANLVAGQGFFASREVGLLLVGHGSREAVGREEFLATVPLVSDALGGVPLEACFLEFAEPTIPEGVRRLIARGVRRIVVVPALLFSAGHAKRDIPVAVAQAAAEYGDVQVWQSSHLGCHEALVRLSHERYRQAIVAQAGSESAEDAWLVMVGRGSQDDEATVEMRQFAALRAARLPKTRVEVGFVAMAAPKLTDVLDAAVAAGARQIVVQPHLLFGGVLVDRIAGIVADYAAHSPDVRWITTSHLGPTPDVAHAIAGRAGEQLSPIECSPQPRHRA